MLALLYCDIKFMSVLVLKLSSSDFILHIGIKTKPGRSLTYSDRFIVLFRAILALRIRLE